MHAPSQLPLPILLRGSLHETIWGGQRLATVVGKQLPKGGMIGESWETATDSVAVNSAYSGTTLGDLVAQYGEALLGRRAVEIFGLRFPLLAKFIDAQQWLSVQVHPDDTYAAAHEGGKLGKTEAWYILDAQPGAELVYGLNRDVSRNDVLSAIQETRLEELLHTIPARAGDVIFVPAGTVHAIGSGICLYELQEYSDVTYRLYDYGRLQANGQPRQLHVDQGLDVMQYGPPATSRALPVAVPPEQGLTGRQVLVACRYFVLEELVVAGEYTSSTEPSSCQIISVLEGDVSLRVPAGEEHLGQGDTAVLPAGLGTYALNSTRARFMRSYVPTEDDTLLRLWTDSQSAG